MSHPDVEINHLWNYKQLAEFIGCSESNAKRLRIPRIRIGRLIRFDPIQVRAWVNSYSIPRQSGGSHA